VTPEENEIIKITSDSADVATASDGQHEAHLAVDAALGKKALQPILLNVTGMCSYTNYILVLSGRSDRQVDAIADGVVMSLREHGMANLGTEGRGSGQWVLIDFGDLIVHVFHHPIREHYDIESLWIDAPRVTLELPPEALVVPEDAYMA